MACLYYRAVERGPFLSQAPAVLGTLGSLCRAKVSAQVCFVDASWRPQGPLCPAQCCWQ